MPEKVRVLGEGRLPPAKPVTSDQLVSGKEDSQSVEITGIVRSVRLEEASQHQVIEIATGGGRLAGQRALPARKNGR